MPEVDAEVVVLGGVLPAPVAGAGGAEGPGPGEIAGAETLH